MVLFSCFVFITIESLFSTRLHAQTYRESTSIVSFSDLNVECSLPTCTIYCDTEDGCNALSINASKSDSLELYCSSSSSCNELSIVHGPSQKLTVSCEGSKSCDSMILNSPYTWHIDITCAGFASCTSADFNVASALQVDINCLGWSCMFVQFGVEDVHRLSFSGAMQFTEMNAISIVESFNVDCSGTCNDVSLYCPMSEDVQCNVYCNGCLNNFELYPASFDQLEFQCSSRELACEGVTVYCAEDEASSSTDLRYDRLHGSFVCENERCCPDNMRRNTTTVYCSANECEMTCLNGGCPIKTVLDASNASSLLLECSTDAECKHLSLICPAHGVCDIRCTAPYACQYVDISASNASSLSILCEADYACQYLQIDAVVVDSADISCSASYSCRDARIEIVGVAMYTNTTLTARQTQSFRSSLVNVTNSKIFNVVCTPSNSAYPGTCGYADFHANNINEMSVVCEGSLCAEYVRWSLTVNDVSFFCDGDNSCYSMKIYASVQNRFALNSDTSAALDRAKLYVSCEDQMLISGCNQNISVVCGGEDEPLGPWPPANPNNDTCANCTVDGIFASPHQILFVANSWDIVCPIADMTTTASTMGTSMASLTGSSNTLIATLIAHQELEIINTRSTALATDSNSEVNLPSTATSNAVNGTVIRLLTVLVVLLVCIVLVLCGVYRVKANKQQRELVVHQANLSELIHSSSSANVFAEEDEAHLHGYGDGNHTHGHVAQNASLPEVLDEFRKLRMSRIGQPTPGEHEQNYDPNPMEQDRVERWFLTEVNLPQYCQLFVSTGYETLDIIRAINNVSELSEIGVSSPQHQQQILQAVIQLRMTYVANETTNRFGDGERHSSVVEGGRDKYNRSFAVRVDPPDHEKRLLLVAQEMMEEDDEMSSSSSSCVHKTGTGGTQGGTADVDGLLHDDIDDVKNNVDIGGNGDNDDDDDSDVSVNNLEVIQPDLSRLNSDYNVIGNSETLGGEEKHVLVHSLRGLENDVDIDQIHVHGVESQGATNTARNMLTLQ